MTSEGMAATELARARLAGWDFEVLAALALDLALAIIPETAAGSRLPPEVDHAIDGARRQLAAAYRNRDMPGVLDAVRGLAAAAAPYEASWTPELSGAVQALARHGALERISAFGGKGDRP